MTRVSSIKMFIIKELPVQNSYSMPISPRKTALQLIFYGSLKFTHQNEDDRHIFAV